MTESPPCPAAHSVWMQPRTIWLSGLQEHKANSCSASHPPEPPHFSQSDCPGFVYLPAWTESRICPDLGAAPALGLVTPHETPIPDVSTHLTAIWSAECDYGITESHLLSIIRGLSVIFTDLPSSPCKYFSCLSLLQSKEVVCTQFEEYKQLLQGKCR